MFKVRKIDLLATMIYFLIGSICLLQVGKDLTPEKTENLPIAFFDSNH